MKGSGASKTPEKINETADERGRDDLEGKVNWVVKSSICQTKKLESSFNNHLEIRVLRFSKLKCNDQLFFLNSKERNFLMKIL